MPTRPGGVRQQQGEPLDAAADGDVIHFDAALGQQLLDVAVGQAEAQVPAHRKDDHVGRKTETSEGRSCDSSGARAAGSHGDSLSCAQQVQQRPAGHSPVLLSVGLLTACSHTQESRQRQVRGSAVVLRSISALAACSAWVPAAPARGLLGVRGLKPASRRDVTVLIFKRQSAGSPSGRRVG
jgi:hypothetical protein